MKRCNRFSHQENDPYLQFNFEKSLRKYQKITNKKIKMHTHISQNSQNIQRNTQSRISNFQEGEELNSIKSNNQIVPNQEKPLQNQSSPIEQLALLNQKSQNQSLKIEPNEIDLSHNLQNSEAIVQEEHSDLLVTKKDNDQLIIEQDKCHHQSSLQIQPLTKQAEKDQNLGGRFHLNHNVFISKRSLQRLVKSNNQQCIVNQLLRNRAYLQNQKQAIFQRLKEFMNLK